MTFYQIDNTNVFNYIKQQYKIKNISVKKTKIISNIQPLLQKDYGLDNDCTLTAITTVLNYLLKNKDPEKIYQIVEMSAGNIFYNGNSYGTIPIFTKKIIDKADKFLNINRRNKSRYLKSFGYSWNQLKNLIDNNKPVIISMANDQRNYYSNHTITIVGYKIFYDIRNHKEIPMLMVYDNWHNYICYLDYNAISFISSINYY